MTTPTPKSRIHNVTFDCHDPYRIVRFWSAVTGWPDDPSNPNNPDDPEGYLPDPDGGPGLLFIKVPEAKTRKNRVHLDLQPTDRTRDETVAALLELGASLVDDRRRPDGSGWVVLADPEGNELCIERSAAERAATADTIAAAGPRDVGASAPERAGYGGELADERTTLVRALDWYRDGVLLKVEGAGPDALRFRPGRSATSMGALLKHLALVEDTWFTERFLGTGAVEPWASAPLDDDPDWDFHSAADDAPEVLVGLYRAAIARSRAIVDAAASLDERSVLVSPRTGERWTLRWILVHLLEETARHLGHLDLLRELADGTLGE